MKRNKENVPGFDDIIFRDRNKEYGAYDLRRRYGSTMGISLLAGLLLGTSPFIVPWLASDPGSGNAVDPVIISTVFDPALITPPEPPEAPPPPRAPVEEVNNVRFIPPEVVTDGQEEGEGVLPADILNDLVINGDAAEEIPVDLVSVDPIVPVEPEPYVIVQEMPSFPGGKEALILYIAEHVVYPGDALENRIQGTVLLRFVVSSTGRVERVEVTRSVDPLLDNEAMRVISGMPRWKPGRQDGNPVPVWFALPVAFVIR